MNAVRLATDPCAAVELLRQAERFSVDGSTAEQMAAGCAVFELLADGRVVGAFTFDVQGDTLRCGAAAGRGRDLAGTVARFAESEARRIGVRRLVCETRRPGLVRRLQREGYRVAYILTKEV